MLMKRRWWAPVVRTYLAAHANLSYICFNWSAQLAWAEADDKTCGLSPFAGRYPWFLRETKRLLTDGYCRRLLWLSTGVIEKIVGLFVLCQSWTGFYSIVCEPTTYISNPDKIALSTNTMYPSTIDPIFGFNFFFNYCKISTANFKLKKINKQFCFSNWFFFGFLFVVKIGNFSLKTLWDVVFLRY